MMYFSFYYFGFIHCKFEDEKVCMYNAMTMEINNFIKITAYVPDATDSVRSKKKKRILGGRC